jgi:hypothetical protein
MGNLMRRTTVLITSACLLLSLSLAGAALAAERSYFSPIIDVDAKRGFIFISADSGIVIVKASEAAMPHLGKLPRMGMIDLVAEVKPGHNVVYLKSWKLVGGESDCKVFDGKACK